MKTLKRMRSSVIFRAWMATRKHLPASVYYEDDGDATILVSYPKSGNTWMRFIIANLMRPDDEVNFGNIDKILPDIGRVSTASVRHLQQPRIIKSHSAFNPAFKRIIYVVRDPRDVFISEFYYHKKYGRLPSDAKLDDFINYFLRGSLTPVSYGNWQSHVASWLALPEGPESLWVRYEDLCGPKAATIITKVGTQLNLKVTEKAVLRALANSSSDRMKKFEKDSRWASEKKAQSNKTIPFVREARSGQWVDALSKETAKRIEDEWGLQMRQLGYL